MKYERAQRGSAAKVFPTGQDEVSPEDDRVPQTRIVNALVVFDLSGNTESVTSEQVKKLEAGDLKRSLPLAD